MPTRSPEPASPTNLRRRTEGTGTTESFRQRWSPRSAHLLAGVLALSILAVSGIEAQVLPRPDPPFEGRIDIDPRNSTPAWPEPVRAPDGAPNIVLILLDDVGFAATSTLGGATPTPALDQLAAGGLRYNSFHVTPMCAPTRAARFPAATLTRSASAGSPNWRQVIRGTTRSGRGIPPGSRRS